MSKTETQMSALLQRQTSCRDNKKSSEQEVKKSREQESKSSRTQEIKRTGGQEIKKSRDLEFRRTRVVEDSSGRTRRPANITICDDVKDALDILAVKRHVRSWLLIDQALREFLKNEGVSL